MGKAKNTSVEVQLHELAMAVQEMRRLQLRWKTERTALLQHAILQAEKKVDMLVASYRLVYKPKPVSKPEQARFNWLSR
ncbi:MAG TPA: hypothetical protein PKD90_05685 [Phnomibacter sp.]|nr:hypothetical protein [Lacibacter sp.]HMO89544.1 hypothetical protein [Lacibacter sp.]HMP92342.1 hypothetical protein [Phnomibacter sp.]